MKDCGLFNTKVHMTLPVFYLVVGRGGNFSRKKIKPCIIVGEDPFVVSVARDFQSLLSTGIRNSVYYSNL